MSPALLLQQLYPLQGAGKWCKAPIAHNLPIELFFRVTNLLDYRWGSLFAQPLPENGVVPLSEGGEELFVGDRTTLVGHSVAPRLPMVFGRIDEGPIHVPEYCAINDHDCPVEVLVGISGIHIDLVKFNL